MKERITAVFGMVAKQARAHRIMAGIIALIVVWGGYTGSSALFSTKAGASYILGTVQKGTLVVSVSGSGQIAASQQVDVKSKASGDVTFVGVKVGQSVKVGAVLAYLDSSDAQKAVRDAQVSLQSATIQLQKLQHDQVSGASTTADDLDQSYKDAFNKVSNAFLDLPGLLDGVRGVLYDSTLHGSCSQNLCEYGNLISQDQLRSFKALISRAEDDYAAAKAAYDPNFADYRGMRLDAAPEDIVAILTATENTATLLAQAIKSEQNMLDTLTNDMKDQAARNATTAHIPSQVSAYQSDIASAISSANSILSSVSGAQRSIDSAKRSLDDGQLTDPLDLASEQNSVAQRQAALDDARANLAHYAVRAPFDGVITKMTLQKGDSLSQGGAVATIITHQRIATISLNEVDVAKVHVGQKVTLTFDAVSDLTITGSVIELDALGTVSQGVVTYNATIGFDGTDDRIKPGMSVSAAIITDSKLDVLVVPSGAVKSQGGTSYVQIPDAVAPGTAQIAAGVATLHEQTIQTGLASDTMTEVVSGLAEGDTIVVRTIMPTTKAEAQSSSANGLRLPAGGTGFGGGAGGTFRTGR